MVSYNRPEDYGDYKTIMSSLNKAVFLDRDGVINYPALNPATGNYEAPFNENDLKLFSFSIDCLKELERIGYKLFIVTNQPDFAKGKTTLENLKSVQEKMLSLFKESNITITEYFACFHHPQGIVPEYTMKCECRKPGNFFLKQAEKKYNIDLKDSWMLGDRDTDIQCGQSAGTRTILIHNEYSVNEKNAGKSNPDFKAKDLREAVELIRNAPPLNG